MFTLDEVVLHFSMWKSTLFSADTSLQFVELSSQLFQSCELEIINGISELYIHSTEEIIEDKMRDTLCAINYKKRNLLNAWIESSVCLNVCLNVCLIYDSQYVPILYPIVCLNVSQMNRTIGQTHNRHVIQQSISKRVLKE